MAETAQSRGRGVKSESPEVNPNEKASQDRILKLRYPREMAPEERLELERRAELMAAVRVALEEERKLATKLMQEDGLAKNKSVTISWVGLFITVATLLAGWFVGVGKLQSSLESLKAAQERQGTNVELLNRSVNELAKIVAVIQDRQDRQEREAVR